MNCQRVGETPETKKGKRAGGRDSEPVQVGRKDNKKQAKGLLEGVNDELNLHRLFGGGRVGGYLL